MDDRDGEDKNSIILETHYSESVKQIYDHLTEIHLQRLWMSHTVNKLPSGVQVSINLPLHQILIKIRIVELVQNKKVVWLVDTEYVRDTSLVTILLESEDEGTTLHFKEVAEFDESRWTRAKEIHEDIWNEMFQRLSKLF